MDRRMFMRRAAGAAGLALGPLAAGCRGAFAEGCTPRSGVQLYTLRAELGRDPAAALASLARIGIEEVEPFGLTGSGALFGRGVEEIGALLGELGLAAPLSHVDGNVEAEAGLADAAHALGVATLVMGLAPDFADSSGGRFRMVGAQSLAQLDRLAARLNALGERFRAFGLRFGYHNHHVEFLPVEGRIGYDYLMARTDPELVAIELDVGWIAAAGLDPVEYLQRYAGRIIACHLKDFRADGPRSSLDDFAALQGRLVEPGAGSVDFARVLEAMRGTGVEHGFIEIDVTAEPLQAVERGHAHVSALSGCDARR